MNRIRLEQFQVAAWAAAPLASYSSGVKEAIANTRRRPSLSVSGWTSETVCYILGVMKPEIFCKVRSFLLSKQA